MLRNLKLRIWFQFLAIMHEDWIIGTEAAKRLKKIQEVQVEKLNKEIEITKAEYSKSNRT